MNEPGPEISFVHLEECHTLYSVLPTLSSIYALDTIQDAQDALQQTAKKGKKAVESEIFPVWVIPN